MVVTTVLASTPASRSGSGEEPALGGRGPDHAVGRPRARLATASFVARDGRVLVPAEHLRDLAAALPRGVLALFAGVGHFPEVEAPAQWSP